MKNKIRLFKITDPIVQSLLFILFAYSIDGRISHQVAFLILFSWQLVSVVAHQFFKRTTMLKTPRKIHLAVLAAYILAYIGISLTIPEKYFEDQTGDGIIKLPVYNTALIAAGLLICFWYSVICFREIRRILKKSYGLTD